MRKLFTLALLAFAGLARAEDGTFRFYGYAYDLDSGKYIYTERHEAKVVGDKWVGGSVTYLAPDGSIIGSKTLDFSNDPFIPIFKMDLTKEGYMEAITDNGATIVMAKKSGPGKNVETGTLKKDGPMAADSGFHTFLVAHFDELMAGKAVKFRFVVAGNLDSFKFKAKRIADTTFEGKPAVRFLVEVDSLLSLLAGPLEVTYDPVKKMLLEYRGISNLHDPATGKAYNARIDYYSTAPADAPKLPALN